MIHINTRMKYECTVSGGHFFASAPRAPKTQNTPFTIDTSDGVFSKAGKQPRRIRSLGVERIKRTSSQSVLKTVIHSIVYRKQQFIRVWIHRYHQSYVKMKPSSARRESTGIASFNDPQALAQKVKKTKRPSSGITPASLPAHTKPEQQQHEEEDDTSSKEERARCRPCCLCMCCSGDDTDESSVVEYDWDNECCSPCCVCSCYSPTKWWLNVLGYKRGYSSSTIKNKEEEETVLLQTIDEDEHVPKQKLTWCTVALWKTRCSIVRMHDGKLWMDDPSSQVRLLVHCPSLYWCS